MVMNKSMLLSSAVLLALVLAGAVSAQTVYSVQSGDWNTLSTWEVDPGGANQIPTAANLTYISPSHTIDISAGGDAEYLIVGQDDFSVTTGLATLNVGPGAALNLVGDDPGGNGNSLSVGFTGTDGRINQTGGTITSNQWSYLGNNTDGGGSDGLLDISGGIFQTAGPNGHLAVGHEGGVGTVVQTGGDVTISGDLRMGSSPTDTGDSSYTISGNSSLTVNGSAFMGTNNDAEFRVIGSGPSIQFTGSFTTRNGTDPNADLPNRTTLAFEIDESGISPIQIDSGFASFRNGTIFDISGGEPGQSYTLISTSDEIFPPDGKSTGNGFDNGWVITNPTRYSLAVSCGDLVVTVHSCTEKLAQDLNGDCVVDWLDWYILENNWMVTGVIE
jgi:hypothetical protein